MNKARKAVILVPSWSGGIDRLFESLDIGRVEEKHNFQLSTFKTHGRSLKGLSVLPFSVVYYTSAAFYTVFLLPFRLLKFAALCAFRRVDICHINLSTGASTIRKIVFAWICRLFKVKYVIHLHGGKYRLFFAGLSGTYRKIVRSFYCHAARVIVLGQLWKDFVVEDIGVASEAVDILPNAVSGPATLDHSRKSDPPNILFLGRLVTPKGAAELVDALSNPLLASMNWTATLAGDGEIAKYTTMVREAGLDKRVNLTGWLENEAVAAVLEMSSIFVLPSHSENLPLSMLEAMAYSLCPIVTPVGSVEDVIDDGRNGIIVPVRNSAALANALISLLKDSDKCIALGRAARADFLSNYDINNYRGKLETIYDAALSNAI